MSTTNGGGEGDGEMENKDKFYMSKSQSIKWWSPSDDNTFANYCKATSIHGLRYIGTEGMHVGERILWTIVFVASAAASFYLIRDLVNQYLESPVTVTFDSVEMFIEQVPFPAVTVCNMNRVLKSKAEEYIREASEVDEDEDDEDVRVRWARQNVYYLDHVCEVSNTPFSKFFNYSSPRGHIPEEVLRKATQSMTNGDDDQFSVKKFLKEASQPCDEMIKLCMWQGSRLVCDEMFQPILTTYGQCCVFNMYPDVIMNNRWKSPARDLLAKWRMSDTPKMEDLFDTTYKYPMRQNKAGKGSGLMILVNPELDEYFCTSSDSIGFRVAIHVSTDIPHVNDFGLAIKPGYEHFISITPSVTIANKALKSIHLNKRKCYFENEFPLDYYQIYSASNCFDECVANRVHFQCNCVRYYMPQDNQRDICDPEHYRCATDVIRETWEQGVKARCSYCIPTCTEVKYSKSVTTAPLESLDIHWRNQFNQTPEWASKNVSIINIFMEEDAIYPRTREQLYTIQQLIANSGGLLGLCMGFSLLSLFEIIYHVTFRPWCHRKKKIITQMQADPEAASALPDKPTNGVKKGSNSFQQDDSVAVDIDAGTSQSQNMAQYQFNSNGKRSTPPSYSESVRKNSEGVQSTNEIVEVPEVSSED